MYTDPPQEMYFLYNEKLHFLFLLCIFSLLPYELKIHSILFTFSHAGLLMYFLAFIKSVLTNLKSLSVQMFLIAQLQPS